MLGVAFFAHTIVVFCPKTAVSIGCINCARYMPMPACLTTTMQLPTCNACTGPLGPNNTEEIEISLDKREIDAYAAIFHTHWTTILGSDLVYDEESTRWLVALWALLLQRTGTLAIYLVFLKKRTNVFSLTRGHGVDVSPCFDA